MSEAWKAVQGFEGYYEVSNRGRIRGCTRTIRRYSSDGSYHECTWKGGIRKLQPHSDGYLRVNLRKEGTERGFYVHRLVAEAFIPNPSGLPEVNHIDSDRSNNRAENLEWVSPSGNRKHGYAFGNIEPPQGADQWSAKLNPDKVRRIRRLGRQGVEQRDIASMFDVAPSTINDVVNRRTWKNVT